MRGRSGKEWPRKIRLRDVSLYVDAVGHGEPLVVMHGGPSGDLWTMAAFRRCADRHTLVFYDHRCNGRSVGVPVSSMTWDNLTADADALRNHLGFERWAVLGHSFGGHVALEHALRYPERVSRLVLLDTGADSRWARENAPRVVAGRGFGPAKVELVRRWFHGEFTPREYLPIFWRISDAYVHGSGVRFLARVLAEGGWRSRVRPEALIFAGQELLAGWSVLDRLAEISVPTLVMAGRQDFVFPPECQQELADRIPGARLVIVDDAGHNPHDEKPDQVLRELRKFLGPGGGTT
ncbi:alpha/beta fold hydrolase [Nocardioides mesophilus]|nr:alpha/beta hydrolase [Nocardioides mesophilus]